MKVLIIQTAFSGDVILATPLIEKLKEHESECTIHFLLKKGNESLFANHPFVDKVLVFDKKNKFQSLLKIINQVRSESYDYVINTHRFLTTGLITVLSGAANKIGFDKNPMSFLYTNSIKHVISHKLNYIHEIDRNISLLKPLGISGSVNPRLYPSISDSQKVSTKDEFICVAPASIWFTKQFPAHKWCELIDKLPEKYSIFLIGAESDNILCEQIRDSVKAKKVENLAGKLTLLQSAALIKQAKITFANDSTPVHLASSVNAPVAVIYCSTIPEFGFGPLSDNSIIIETKENLACRSCGLHGKKSCPETHFRCSDINIDDVISEVRKSVDLTS